MLSTKSSHSTPSSSMRKSVEDLLTGSGEAIGNSLSQAISITSGLQSSSPSLLRRRSPSPSEKQQISNANLSSGSNTSGSSVNKDFLSVSYNSDRLDGSEDRGAGKSSDGSQGTPSDGQSSCLSKSASAHDIEKPCKTKVPQRAKKKSWYSVLYPSYKSRSEDFKKLFKDVPDDERLVVDYSAALQRDILVHGRLYVSQNYLCFYANIFRWETSLSIKWKDVRAVTKEKTALVIPNAILVCTETEKQFFTSFATRDSAYLMLFRVWQNALMDKPMQPQEMWQWVHNCYGDELGLTSDDEDYIDPYELREEITKNKSIKSASSSKIGSTSEEQSNPESDNVCGGIRGLEYLSDLPINAPKTTTTNAAAAGLSNNSSASNPVEGNESESQSPKQHSQQPKRLSKSSRTRGNNGEDGIPDHVPTDMSDTSDSEQDKNLDLIGQAECTSNHEGRQMIHTILPINVDILFTLLFSKSKFMETFHANRKTTDMVFNEWILDEDGKKIRTFTLTVALTQPVGPKCSHVTEKQELRDCSVPGQLYSVDVISSNGGIPYGDSFFVTMHYCMVRTVDDHSMFSVHAQIQYKKSVWGVVKGFIEKNTWNGLEDFYTALVRALQTEYGIPPAKSKSRRGRRVGTMLPKPPIEALDATMISRTTAKLKSAIPFTSAAALKGPKAVSKIQYKSMSLFVIILLILLIILNIVLYAKLWELEKMETHKFQYPDFTKLRDPPKSHEDWIKIMQEQESLHNAEMSKWQSVLQIAVDLLQKVSVVCRKIVKNSGDDLLDDEGEDDDEMLRFVSSTEKGHAEL